LLIFSTNLRRYFRQTKTGAKKYPQSSGYGHHPDTNNQKLDSQYTAAATMIVMMAIAAMASAVLSPLSTCGSLAIVLPHIKYRIRGFRDSRTLVLKLLPDIKSRGIIGKFLLSGKSNPASNNEKPLSL
jgi:hypothetical protein